MSLLGQTVTLYRVGGTRTVMDHCSFFPQKSITTDHTGTALQKGFTLIVRGAQDIRVGDRIVEGIGPDAEFEELIPQLTDAYTVTTVKPFFWNGKVSHMEVRG